MADPKAQRLEMETEIASLEEAAKVITLHPATLDPCTETVDALAASLVDHMPRTIGCCWKSFRALVDSVTVHSNGPREGSQDYRCGILLLATRRLGAQGQPPELCHPLAEFRALPSEGKGRVFESRRA